MNPVRSLDTIARLHPIQILDRGLRPLRVRWAGLAQRADDVALVGNSAACPIPIPIEEAGQHSIRLLGVWHEHAGEDRWHPAAVSRLWAYRLHCFRWVHGLSPGDGLEWMRDWIRRNPPGTRTAWEPYCLSMRIREWLEWLVPGRPDSVRRGLLLSLTQQTEALYRQVEFHLLGNHLLENAVTLCWAGLRLRCARAHVWLRFGTDLLRRSLREQVLSDGGHAERSPMYQAQIAEGLLRLDEVASDVGTRRARAVSSMARGAGERLLRALEPLVHPDGEYALVNDTALGASPTYHQIARRFRLTTMHASKSGVRSLSETAYLAWRGGHDAYLLLDAGGVGPAHQPGHGHAGALGIEVSNRGQRLITDTGVHTYDRVATRAVDRSTAAHSTIEVDGANQSDVWAAFRCGRRIRPLRPRWAGDAHAAQFRGGYRDHEGRVRHTRTLKVHGGAVHCTDALLAGGEHDLVSRLHLAPGIEARPEGGALLLSRENRRLASLQAADAWHIERSPYHATFGSEVERICLVHRRHFVDSATCSWSLSLH